MICRQLNPGLVIVALLLGGCSDSESETPLYEDVTELSGLAFVHDNGSDDTLALPFILGSGVALFDFDNDSDLDVYLVQGRGDQTSPDELWLNESGNGRLRFRRLPDDPALASDFPGMGVAIADANLDGRLDILVTAFGANRLLLNAESGLVSSASEALIKDNTWSASAVWLDANNDGRPDAYIANVAQFDPNLQCRSATSRLDYCGAAAYVPLHDQLLLNFGATDTGDVVFEDASHDWNLAEHKAPSFGVRAADLNNDSLPDLYVAASGAPNTVWINDQGLGFIDRTSESGASVSFLGRFDGSLGVDAADLDGDNDLDVVVSHYRGEPHQVYVNDGQARFVADDLTAGGVSEADSGAGLVLLDADADGFMDAFVANGAVRQRQSQIDASDALPLRELNSGFLQRRVDADDRAAGRAPLNALETAVDTVTPAAHTELAQEPPDAVTEFEVWDRLYEALTPRPQVSRAVAAGDLDNDGDLDLVVTNNGGPAQVLRGMRNPERWIGINTVSEETGLPLVGTSVRLVNPAVSGVREVRRSHGFLSASDPRLIYYNVPKETASVTFELTWPGGVTERFVVPSEARYHTLIKGQGTS